MMLKINKKGLPFFKTTFFKRSAFSRFPNGQPLPSFAFAKLVQWLGLRPPAQVPKPKLDTKSQPYKIPLLD